MQWQFLVLFCEFKHFQNDIMGKITSCGFFWGKIYPSVLCFLRCISVALCRSRWEFLIRESIASGHFPVFPGIQNAAVCLLSARAGFPGVIMRNGVMSPLRCAPPQPCHLLPGGWLFCTDWKPVLTSVHISSGRQFLVLHILTFWMPISCKYLLLFYDIFFKFFFSLRYNFKAFIEKFETLF